MKTKTEVKHTPGPWEIQGGLDHEHDFFPIVTRSEAKFRNIAAVVTPTHQSAPVEEGCANARLIAVAPDLLEAAIILSNEWEREESGGVVSVQAISRLRAAIAKAEGH